MGIDAGTESIRAVLFDFDGCEIAQASCANQTDFPLPGRAEQSPEQWMTGLITAVKECCARVESFIPEDVVSLCIDGTCSTVVTAYNDGTVIGNAIMWMDTRATEEVARIACIQHPVLKYCGDEDAVEWLVPKALWLKNHEPSRYKQADKIVEALDYLTFRLCGQWSASVCNATDAWNYVSKEGGFCQSFFDAIGLSDLPLKFPKRILQMGDCAGVLTAKAATMLGLKAGTIVAQGGIDAHAGMLGMGIVKSGIMGMTIGSSSVHLVLTDGPKFAKGIWGPYPDAILRGKWLMQGGQNSTGSVLRWFKDNFAHKTQQQAQQNGKPCYAILDEKAALVPAGARGLTALEYFQGNRSPYRDPLANGVLIGLTLAHQEEDIFRAFLEAAAFGTRAILESLYCGGVSIDELRACGGGTKSSLWLQIHADVCGLPITLMETDNTAALGSAMCAAIAAKRYPDFTTAVKKMTNKRCTIHPNPTQSLAYDPFYLRYLDLYQALKPLWHNLNATK